jgi:hypothetical protein
LATSHYSDLLIQLPMPPIGVFAPIGQMPRIMTWTLLLAETHRFIIIKGTA